MANICQKCILTDKLPGVSINKEGLCSRCVSFGESGKDTGRFVKIMEKIFKEAKKKERSYDCAVQFSGGKDSSYVLYLLKKKYGMRVLAVSFVHPFSSKIARENAETITKKLGIDLLFFHLNENLFKNYFSKGLPLALGKYDLGTDGGCILCSYLRHSAMFNLAASMKIPIVATGVSSEQSSPVILETTEEKENFFSTFLRDPSKIAAEVSTDHKKSFFHFDQRAFEKRDWPCLIYPLTFLKYDVEEIYKTLEKAGLARRDKVNSSLTNCSLTGFFNHLSFKRYGLPIGVGMWASQIRKTGRLGKLPREKVISGLVDEWERASQMFADKKMKKHSSAFLKKTFPLTHQFLGDRAFSLWAEKLSKIRFFADYFNLDIDSINKK